MSHAGILQRRLGRTGLQVSALGFGCGAVGGLMVKAGPAEQRRAVAMALDAGITYFDTAPSYGDGASEENLGRVLRELGADDRVVVGTKVRLSGDDLVDTRTAVRRSLENSLRRLHRDSVDLLQLHNPIGQTAATPSGEAIPVSRAFGDVAAALAAVAVDGLARHVGFTGIGETPHVLEAVGHPVYETVQAYLNALNPSSLRAGAASGEQDFDAVIERAAASDCGVIAIRILAAGALIGSGERHPIASLPGSPLVPGSEYEVDVDRARRLQSVVHEFGLDSGLELGVRFAVFAPGVAVALVGLSTVDHLAAAIEWTKRGPLPGEAVERLIDLAAARS